MDENNAIQILGIAEVLTDSAIKSYCMHFIANNYDRYFAPKKSFNKQYESLSNSVKTEIQSFVIKNKK